MAGSVSEIPRRQGPPSTRISLLQDVRDGRNAEAWRAFVDRYTPLVYRYCRQRGIQEADARDITQNVFFAVSRAMHSFEYDASRGRFRSWLGTITCREIRRYLSWVNRLRNAVEEGRVQVRTCDESLTSDWDTYCTKHLFWQAVQEVRPTFAADVWQAFERTWFQDEAPVDVAAALQRPVAWVYKAKFRVLQRLRGEVETLAADVPLRPK